jgi:hypothetical protein
MNEIDVLAFFDASGAALVRENDFERLIEATGSVDIALVTGHIEGVDNVVAKTAFESGCLVVSHGIA